MGIVRLRIGVRVGIRYEHIPRRATKNRAQTERESPELLERETEDKMQNLIAVEDLRITSDVLASIRGYFGNCDDYGAVEHHLRQSAAVELSWGGGLRRRGAVLTQISR